jgi:hypothetical protein
MMMGDGYMRQKNIPSAKKLLVATEQKMIFFGKNTT